MKTSLVMHRWRTVFSSALELLAVSLVLAAASNALAQYRSLDGSGNNMANPTWGEAGTQLSRIATPAYGDGISTPAGSTRPGAREISNALVAQSVPMPNSLGLTDWIFQWGQFVDHDIDLTGAATPTESLPIAIPADDAFFNPAIPMPFSRSIYDAGTGITDPRQQINQITSYLDGSVVYGSDLTRATALRAGAGGMLKTSGDNLLPKNTMGLPNADNGAPDPTQYFVAGDVRVNEQVGLTAVQTLFVREHNRLAAQIGAANPLLDDEMIYQRARELVGAEIQAITYNEFLPALLGPHGLPAYTGYKPDVDASVLNEISTAFYRVGHTMLSPQLQRMQNDGTPAPGGPLALRDAFFVPNNIANSDELTYLLKGLASEPQQEIDIKMVDDVRNFMFGDPMAGTGFDLASLNIQRGRDHGLPDYNTLRVAFGLSAVTSFSDISSDPAIQATLASLYGNVNNIDAWVGALSEDHLAGAAVGELIAAALVEQFTRTRDGDRYWYQNNPDLSAADIAMIESTTLCGVILRNTEMTNLQLDVFRVPEPSTYVLAGMGGVVILAFALRRRRARSS
jgi:peroxidase